MSIKASTLLGNTINGNGAAISTTRTPVGTGWTSQIVDIPNTPTRVILGSIVVPHEVSLRNVSGATVWIGLDGSNWPFSLDPEESTLLTLRDIRAYETSRIITAADVAGSLNNAAIELEGQTGNWAIWFNVDSTGTYGGTSANTVEVDLTSNDSAATVATKIVEALAASAAFTADFQVTRIGTSTTITITDRTPTERTAVSGTVAGFTITTVTAGATPVYPEIWALSTGTTVLAYAAAEW